MTKYYRVPSVEGEAVGRSIGRVGSIGGPPLSREDNNTSLNTGLGKEQENFDTESFCCFQSKKQFFVILNAVAAVFHAALFVVTIALTCRSDAGCKGPVVYTYQTNLTYSAKTTTSGFELVPRYDKNVDNPLYLVALPLIFFGLSCGAHVVVSILAGCTNIYRDWLLTCQQPVRWVEYSGSASVMFIGIAYTSGIRDSSMITALFILMFCVMTYGWVCEMLADRTVLSTEYFHWRKTETWGPFFIRLFPNILGYVPYVTAYYIVIEQFMRVTAEFKGPNVPDGRQIPWWVDMVVIGQCAVFSCFAIVSILQQGWEAKRYYIGEIMYIVLSFFSKGLLGMTLIFGVLQSGDFEDAFVSDASR